MVRVSVISTVVVSSVVEPPISVVIVVGTLLTIVD
jgi:hypothetical protein